jgi:hypothetical protein
MSGTGAPDLLVARGDRMILLECKAPAGPRGGVSGRGLTDAQKLWHAKWPTKIHIARTTDDAIAVAVREFGIQGNLVPVATAWDDDIDVGGKPFEP